MSLQLTVSNNEIHFNNEEIEGIFSNNNAIKAKLVESFIIQIYREAKISIGQVGELLDMSSYEAMQWMNKRGVYKLGSLNPQVDKITDRNREKIHYLRLLPHVSTEHRNRVLASISQVKKEEEEDSEEWIRLIQESRMDVDRDSLV